MGRAGFEPAITSILKISAFLKNASHFRQRGIIAARSSALKATEES